MLETLDAAFETAFLPSPQKLRMQLSDDGIFSVKLRTIWPDEQHEITEMNFERQR